MNIRAVSFLTVLLASTSVSAADIEVRAAWVRATVPAQTASGAFMAIVSKAGATLVGVSTPVADEVEVHEMKMEGGVMKMRASPRVPLPAGRTVTFKPGGYHIMLMGLKRQMKPGETVPVTLKIENANRKIDSVQVNAKVRELAEPASPP
jgi:periplasmic copper chaperone A